VIGQQIKLIKDKFIKGRFLYEKVIKFSFGITFSYKNLPFMNLSFINFICCPITNKLNNEHNNKSLASVVVLALVLAACGNGGGGKDKTITVGASPAPHLFVAQSPIN
jgi:predicted small secreted protein